jgi:hypothetical protein
MKNLLYWFLYFILLAVAIGGAINAKRAYNINLEILAAENAQLLVLQDQKPIKIKQMEIHIEDPTDVDELLNIIKGMAELK